MNKSLFRTGTPVPKTNTHNNAGGTAYKSSDVQALAQYACTGVFNGTYYTQAAEQLKMVEGLCKKVDAMDIAKIAVYARTEGFMKDVPAYLVTYLFAQKDERSKAAFNLAFPIVINNVGQLRKFTRMVRSGVCGRRSFGSAGKRVISNMLNGMGVRRLFWQSVGSDPSLADVLKLAHVRPMDSEHDAFFAYMLGKAEPEDFEKLPENIQQFELAKRGEYDGVPDVPFQRLNNLNLSTSQWGEVMRNMSWNQLRFNLNNLARKGVFKDREAVAYAAATLRDPKRVKGSRVLPYSMYSTYKALGSDLPQALKNAMSDAMEIAVANAPVLGGKTLVLVDVSGSMSASATGNQGKATTSMTCSDVASFFAASLLKADPDNVTVKRFNTSVVRTNVNPRDSVASITRELSRHEGGTTISCGIDWALRLGAEFDNIIVLSDNESWGNHRSWYTSTGNATPLKSVFNTYKRKKKNAKLIAVNCSASTTTVQAPDDASTLNIGGLNDNVFKVISQFIESRGNTHWQDVLSQIKLD